MGVTRPGHTTVLYGRDRRTIIILLYTIRRTAVPFMWGSLRLAPINIFGVTFRIPRPGGFPGESPRAVTIKVATQRTICPVTETFSTV